MTAAASFVSARCKLLRFVVGDRPYVAEIERIREIVFYRPSIPVPQAPPFLEGVIDLRGVAIPLIDLRERLGVPVNERRPPVHILVVRLGDALSGLTVDAVSDVLEVEESSFQEPADSAGRRPMCRGVCRIRDELVLVLDLDGLLTADECAALMGVI